MRPTPGTSELGTWQVPVMASTLPAMADDVEANRRAWIVAVCNQKGGVGKTTTAINLASVFADSSGRVMVVDADPQRSASEFAAAAGDLLPFEVLAADSRADTVAGLRDRRGLDTVLVDCAGNLQDTPPSARSWPSPTSR